MEPSSEFRRNATATLFVLLREGVFRNQLLWEYHLLYPSVFADSKWFDIKSIQDQKSLFTSSVILSTFPSRFNGQTNDHYILKTEKETQIKKTKKQTTKKKGQAYKFYVPD